MDTQADISVFKYSSLKFKKFIDLSNTIEIKGITNETINSLGVVNIKLQLDNVLSHDFHLVNDEFNINTDGIIGKDFLIRHNCSINYTNMTFTINSQNEAHIFKISQGPTENTMIIPPRCEIVKQFQINSTEDCVVDQMQLAPNVYTARTIASKNSSFIRVINTGHEPQIVSNIIEKVEPLSDFHCYSASVVSKDTQRIDTLNEILKDKTPTQFIPNIYGLTERFSDVFALPNDQMTTNNFYNQKLRLSDNTPSYVKNYRTPHSQKDEIKRQVEKLIKNDLIEPSNSSYNSPIILVPKKSSEKQKSWRMCIDYRKVNKNLIPDRFPLPRIDDILDNLGRSKFFSVLDLYSGFHQVPIEIESRDITAFSTDQGSFRWKVLPFGLNVSPNSFVRMMNLAFSGLPVDQLFIYIDDIIVLGKSESDHMKNLEATLTRCRERNLKINPEKCQFFKREVNYLGHVCSTDGISPDPSKFDSIKKVPIPRNADEVRRFVAMANYYRKFINNFSVITIPLNKLTKKNSIFSWDAQCQNAFDKIKTLLCSAPLLAYPDYSKEFTVTVDASKLGVGSVLSQDDKPISYASKNFNPADQNKSTIEQELIAIHFSINYFKHYLYGTHFKVRSDHKPLIYLFNLKNPSSKLTRLRLDLAEYNFEIEHLPGTKNVVADCLSRIHIDDIKNITNYDDNVVLALTRAQARKQDLKLKDIKQVPSNKNKDVQIKRPKIISAENNILNKGIPIMTAKYNHGNSTMCIEINKKYKSGKNIFKYVLYNDSQLSKLILSSLNKMAHETGLTEIKMVSNDEFFNYVSLNDFKNMGNDMLSNLTIYIINPIVQVSARDEKLRLIQKYHDDPIFGGHRGVHKVYQNLKQFVSWKDMYKEIKEYVSRCPECQKCKPHIRTKEEMVLTDTPSGPFEKISVDTVGPLSTSESDNKYALTIMCELSKYLISTPIPSKDAKTVAKAIVESLILIHGPVRIILTDQGTEYANAIFKEITEFFKIDLIHSVPYHHQTLGANERSHRSLNEYLRIYLNEVDEWEDYLKSFTFCYNISTHASFDDKLSPFQIIFGRKVLNEETFFSNKITPIYNLENYAKELKFKLEKTSLMAKKYLEASKIKSKESYDRKLNKIEIKIGDKIIVLDETRGKFDPLYKGPFTVTGIQHPNVTYLDQRFNRNKIVHKNNVKKFNE